MFGTLGGPELFLIFVVALIIFGPRKLPEIGKSLGRMMAEFRKASNEFRSTIESEVEAEKIRDALRLEPPAVAPGAPVFPHGAAATQTETNAPGAPTAQPETPAAGSGTAAAQPPATPPTAQPDDPPVATVSRRPDSAERVLDDVRPVEPR
jgi:sec-independent protein translocase protein TatB